MIMTTSIPGMSPTRNGGDGRGAGGGTGQLASQSTQLHVVELAWNDESNLIGLVKEADATVSKKQHLFST